MTVLLFSALLFIISLFAGVLGSLTGLGGGIIVIPALVLLFHINIHYAMGASLISVIATSSGSSVAYLREGYTNMRIAMFLGLAAAIGAFLGAAVLPYIPEEYVKIIFALVLIYSAILTIRRKDDNETPFEPDPLATKFKLNGHYPLDGRLKRYNVKHVPLAFSIMGIAGLLSGLLGIGSGCIKVVAMDSAMGLPYKVSTTTSNFMIGVTAAVSAGIYFSHGYIIPAMVFPVMLGVLFGAIFGARTLKKLQTQWLRIIFSLAICFLAFEMLYSAI